MKKNQKELDTLEIIYQNEYIILKSIIAVNNMLLRSTTQIRL